MGEADMAKKTTSAFMKPMTPSTTLAKITGPKALPRTEITKAIWGYIKKHKLQDKTNKRMINADEALKPVFGGKPQVSMFEMTALVSKHLS
jgi:chromatin remodeling complex protein RSC6